MRLNTNPSMYVSNDYIQTQVKYGSTLQINVFNSIDAIFVILNGTKCVSMSRHRSTKTLRTCDEASSHQPGKSRTCMLSPTLMYRKDDGYICLVLVGLCASYTNNVHISADHNSVSIGKRMMFTKNLAENKVYSLLQPTTFLLTVHQPQLENNHFNPSSFGAQQMMEKCSSRLKTTTFFS